jgi:hypothetical protein
LSNRQINISTINVKSAYRSDIDGLRGLAILGELFFHLGVSIFSGGWIGVDIFFIISGVSDNPEISSTINGVHFHSRHFLRVGPSGCALAILQSSLSPLLQSI